VPVAARPYHGPPSGWVCGQRWSYDRGSFQCDGGELSLSELVPFWDLQSVHFVDAKVHVTPGVALAGVSQLALTATVIDGRDLVSSFPDTRSLWLVRTSMDGAVLRDLLQLSSLLVARMPVPAASDLAAVESLRNVDLNFATCGEDGCPDEVAERLRALRPDIVVRVNGRGLTAGRAPGEAD